MPEALPPIPEGACDCHMHIYGDPARYPVASTNPTPPPFEGTLEAYRHVMARLGLSRVIVVQPTAYGADNRCTLDAVAALGPAAARAVVVVAPDTEEAELARLAAQGAQGARAFMMKGGLVPWADLRRLSARVAPLGWHVQLQFDGGELPEREGLIRELECPVVIDHLGRFEEPVTPDHPAFRCLLRLVETGRVWVKASSPYGVSRSGPPDYADVAALARALVKAAPERIVWGSNWPHPNAPAPKPDEKGLLDLLADWAPDEAVRRRILVENAGRLYGFPI